VATSGDESGVAVAEPGALHGSADIPHVVDVGGDVGLDAGAGGRRGIRRITFVIYIAVNMLVCATVLAPWALPRETVSGLCGRLALSGSLIGRLCAALIDTLHWWEVDHCRQVAREEREARRTLYP
jgi:hypothetical protein